MKKKHKYIFIIGGVMSGVGKGVASASLGKILQARGFKVNPIKIDPYLNVDAGTMNPLEHGEVFVLSCGLETDQDMGSYERFLDLELGRENYMTNGMVFKHVIDKERNLEYGGKCVEPVFHISEEILRRIEVSVTSSKADISIVEIGGTVGEYQNSIFIEAARTLKLRHPDDVIFVMVSYLPIPHALGEMKTKPTQNAVRTLNSCGVQPDVIIARSAVPLDQKRKEKIAESVSIPAQNIISAPDVKNIYEVPINFEKDGFSEIVLRRLRLRSKNGSDLSAWKRVVDQGMNATDEVRIGIIGKYFKTGNFVLSDVYLSIIESLKSAAYHLRRRLVIDWLDSVDYENNQESLSELLAYDGILVPGGFGSRGVEGKIAAIQYVRERRIPYFGICYGMQLALVEYARHSVGWSDAHTTEISKRTKHPVIDIMPEQIKLMKENRYGGTMRLGSYAAHLKRGTRAWDAYSVSSNGRWDFQASLGTVRERHRHRYEVNPKYIKELEAAGAVFSGVSGDAMLMEIFELPQSAHPFFLGTQYHPEFTGSVLHPHPLFSAFIKASVQQRNQRLSVVQASHLDAALTI